MVYRKTLVGIRFGRLMPIKKLHKIGHGSTDTKYLCKCDCGSSKLVRYTNLVNKTTQSCGCLQKELLSKRSRKPAGHACKTAVFNYYKRNAAIRNLSWNLTKKAFVDLILSPCFYCKISRFTFTKMKYGDELSHNGVDRVDSSLGYSLKNCVPCCKVCNRAKSNMDRASYFHWLNQIRR